MERFAKYMAAMDGTNDWSVIGPLYDDAIDPDCVFITADGEYDKAQWAETVRKLVDRGAIASGYEVTRAEGDTAYYEVTVAVAGEEPLHMAAKGTLREGRLVRVEPVDPAVYSSLVERSK